jgi:hypothetical protein
MNVEDTAKLLADLEHQREEIDAKIDACKTLLLDAVDAGTTITIGDQPIYRVTRGNLRFNPAKAAEVAPAQALAEATAFVTKLDPKLLKSNLTPAQWEACCDRGAPYLRGV